jgi:MFS family permease
MPENTDNLFVGRLRPLLRSFRYRNYRLFFSGQLISLIGTWMQSVAQAWLVYRLTGSALLLGLVAFASQIPVFLLAPLGGAIADRQSRYRIMIVTQVSSMVLAFVLAALTLSENVAISHIFILAFLFGMVNAFDIPARQAFVVEMVGKNDLVNAIALNSSMINGARIIGPALAGVLVSSVGEGWCFFINGVSYLAVIIGLLWMHIAPRIGAGPNGSIMTQMIDGFHFAARTGPVRGVLLLLGLVSFSGMPYMVLMPIFADRILHGGPMGLGILMSSTGIGALLGALTLAARHGVDGLNRWVMFSAVGFGAALILFSLSHSFWLSEVLLLPAGFFMMLQMAASNTLIQMKVPDHLRGRVMAVYSMMFIGMAPFGALFAGTVAHHWGAPAAVMMGGVACIAGAGLFRKYHGAHHEGS